MSTITSAVEIDRPIHEVYEQWTRFEDYPAFMTGVEEVHQLDERTVYWLFRIAGVERGFEARITEQQPRERIAWSSTSGPANTGEVTFQRVDEGRTRLQVRLEWEPEGFIENLGAALQLDDARLAQDLREFQRLMESGGFAARGGTREDGER